VKRADRGRRGILALGIVLTCCPCASALNPSLDISQYAHNKWTVRDGFFKSGIYTIAQTPDGYLWLGNEFGVLRFDGVRAVPWEPPKGESLPGGLLRKLLVTRDGRLWIGTLQGLASWKDGKLTHYPELAGQDAFALFEDREGTVWAGGAGPARKLCAIGSRRVQCYGEDGRFGRGVASFCEDGQGNLWAAALTGLWRWKPGPPKLYPLPDLPNDIGEDENGALLIATRSGIGQLADGKVQPYPLPGVGRKVHAVRLLQDRNGGLWVGTTDRGLLREHGGRTDAFAQPDGLSGDFVQTVFEDREGNIWAGTLDGLDRFREFAIPTISVKQGLSNADAWSVLTTPDGSVWFGTRGGLNRWNNGQMTVYSRRNAGLADDYVETLFRDERGRIWVSTLRGFGYFEQGRFVPATAVSGRQVFAIAGDSVADLWISDQDRGLLHLLGTSVEQIPWAILGRQDAAYALLPDPEHRALWLGFYRGGVSYFQDGQVRVSYAAADGLGKGFVTGLRPDPDGGVWAATEGGLSLIRNGHVATLTSRNGLPCDTVHWMREDDDHSIWLYMSCGLVRLARLELDAWITDSKRTIQATVFDSSDGVRSHSASVSYSPRVAKSSDGKIWFLPIDGVSVIDPRHLAINKLPPPVHIEEVNADGKPYVPVRGMRLPPLVRDVWIDYTALSYAAPERVRFRYRLEGQDTEWKEVVNEREAKYSNLAPRRYRFRVIACNNSGVWNEAGDTLEFSVDAAYYQTAWFQALCVAVPLAMLWGLYRYRIHQIARQLDIRAEERTRIARELHDTLLQSFQGLMLGFQRVENKMPPGEAKYLLEKTLERADQAIAEGRDSIHDLRSSTTVTNDLADAVKALGDEMASDNGASFYMVVEGAPQDLHPILRDEIYRLAREAVRNAFRHAKASRIEAEISYGEKLFRLRIRDDGRGIAPEIVDEGRAGHYGLPGMRERARAIGGQLHVWTGKGTGTEIELTIPGSVAYGTSPARKGWRLFGRGTG